MSAEVMDIKFVENPLIKDSRDNYLDMTVNLPKVLKSWQKALYAFEWLLPDGRVKPREELSESDREKFDKAETAYKIGDGLEKPIMGIGIMDNVEIGSGRAVFAVLAAHGVKTIQVHVRKSHADDFTKFVAG
jgi:hypothetical protein